MADFIFNWWVWALAGLVLLVLEILAPAFILLGFSIGSGAVAILLLIGGPALVGGTVPFAFLIFAIISLVAWLALRQIFKLPTGQVKIWRDDIND